MSLSELLHDMNPAWRDAKARVAQHFPRRREIYPALLRHLLHEERRAGVLIGPRQVGKTTLLQQLVDALLEGKVAPANVTYVDFSDPRLLSARISPAAVVEFEAPGVQREKPRFFLFDEISRGELWPEWLKQFVDKRRGRFLVTDSASTLLREAARESGQGRWDEFHLEGLSFGEFLDLQPGTFSSPEEKMRALPDPLARYLELGGFPEHALSDSPAEVRRRIRDDIANRAIGSDLLRFAVDVERIRDLFVYLLSDSGAIFDAQTRGRLLHRGGEKGIDRRSLDKWIALLQDTKLIARLELFARAPSAKLAGRAYPKLYAADHGLVAAFAESSDPLADGATKGRCYEAMIYRHLRTYAEAHELSLSHWRERGGDAEIDFVLHDGAKAAALVEVTASRQPEKKAAQLAAAKVTLKAPRAIVVHGGSETSRESAPAWKFMLAPEEWLS